MPDERRGIGSPGGARPAAAAAGILYVEMSRFPSYGGTKRVVVHLASSLDRARFRPHVIVYRDGPWVADLGAAGVPVTVFQPPGPEPAAETTGAVASARETARLSAAGVEVTAGGSIRLSPVRQLVSDLASWRRFFGSDAALARRLVALVPPSTRLIHVNHSMVGNFAWFHVARRLGLPFVSHEHGIWKPRPAAYRAIARRAASVLCLTEERMSELRDFLHGQVRVDYLPNGVPVDALAPARDRAAVRAELGVPERVPVVITAGHIQEWKGQALAVEAAVLLATRGLDFVWLLCGTEVEAAYVVGLRRRIAEAGLEGKVRLLGQRSDLPDLFAASDLAVHTSIHPEPFGLVVLEAMVQGLPVVGPREGAIPTLIRDGVDGRLVPPRDAAALAAAVLEFAGSPELRRTMGAAARSGVRERFDVSIQARRAEAIYQRVLAETRAPHRRARGAEERP
jgi:glycosyltransferase involved in cell wall biosynthesis